MRLTLRTLLAWLDDTLSAAQVREIGKQVNESPVAKELVERIHRVTRQRRLTVPPSKGPEGVDPNVVAAYLDNELDPDAVAELEKKCLTSDLHLAEVASAHQILSLIGQKAKVPAEARQRMYHLIKGREAVRSQAPRASHQTTPKPADEPVQPWASGPIPTRPWYQRFGPPAAVLGLISLLVWSAWMSLGSGDNTMTYRGPADAANAPEVAAAVEPRKAEPAPEKEASDAGPKKDDATPAAGEAVAKKGGSDVPPGSAGLAKTPTGVLMRYDAEKRDWGRITDVTPLREQDRLLSLAPFRSTVEVGNADVDLVDETEVWVRATQPSQAARFALSQGKVVLHGTAPSQPFEVVHGSETLTVLPPPSGTVGVERLTRRKPGEAVAQPPVLRVYAAEGPVSLKAGGGEATIEGPGAVTLDAEGKFVDETSKDVPEWVTEKGPKPFDQSVGDQFVKFFRPDRPVVSGLVEASEDEQKDVCRVAIAGLRAVGDISYVVPLLNKKGDPTAYVARRAAIGVLRSYLSQGGDAQKTLHAQLVNDLGDDQAETVEKLLIGYTPEEAKQEVTYAKLVQLLGTTDPSEVGVRELALDNVQTLTGRDSLEYNPEAPRVEGKDSKGLKAWKTLLAEHELRAAVSAAGK